MSEEKTTLLELTEATEVSETQDFIPVVDVSDDTESTDGTTKRTTVRKMLQDKPLPEGELVGTSDEQTLSNKTLTSPTINSPEINNPTIKGGSIDANTNVVEILTKVYPVGAIYISTVGTNPNTLFGFGTWEEYGSGRVLVGKSSDTEFDTIGKTGGEKTHTLTIAEMPSHNHTVTRVFNGIQSFQIENSIPAIPKLKSADITTTSENTSSVGGGQAHNNLPPYIVVYFFRRTA